MRIAAAQLGVLLVVALSGCEKEQQTGPTTADLSRERKELASKVKQQQATARKAGVKKARAPQAEPEEASFGSVDLAFAYDPRGKRDPFRSFKWEQIALEQAADALRGPLEQFDLSQLSLVAVVWKTGAAKALVQDPSGQAYIVSEGSRIGKNEGHVTQIGDNLLVVKETYVDFLGQETTKDIEMRIRRSHGG